ncbi:uncharacterized protein LOC144716657 [Wolffia australiana]
MPTEESEIDPSPTTIAWSWVVEELADCKEIDSSILAAIVRSNRGIITDSFYGDSARRRLALKFLEELLDSFEEVHSSNRVQKPGSDPTVHGTMGFDQKLDPLDIFGGSPSRSNLNTLRQAVQRRRAALPKPSLDLLKHKIIEECLTRKPTNPAEQDIGNAREVVSKRIKLNPHSTRKLRSDSSILKSASTDERDDQVVKETIQIDKAGKPNEGSGRIVAYSSSDNEGGEDATETFLCNDSRQAERRLCRKCYEGGDLLSCSEINCAIAIHRSCLESSSDIDNPEGFKCPFCLYQRALSDYSEAKKRLSLARKAISAFKDWGGIEKSGQPSNSTNLNQQVEIQSKDHHLDADPSKTLERDDEHPILLNHDHEKELENVSGNAVSLKLEVCEAEGKFDRAFEQKDSSTRKYRRRAARGPKRYSNPIIPCARRNRLPWTEDEESILKEAMEKLQQKRGGLGQAEISWISILDYGKHVFHRTRQPADLKDKWRNLRSKSSS